MHKVKIFGIISILLLSVATFHTEKISVDKKDYQAANTDEVSTRELAMLASLVYEDVPNDSNYSPSSRTAGYGCIIGKDGSVTGKNNSKCFYRALESNTHSSLKRDKYHVYQYVEGLSERKVFLRPVSMLTSAFREDGEQYYFLNFAKTKELEGKWEIVHFASDNTLKGKLASPLPDKATFDAITFKKGNNYVIAFRGTDYPDLFEWGEDLLYAIDGEHKQALNAYTYAQSEYKRLSSDENAKIYVVGHSLGAYLAQVGGAAIIDAASGRTNPRVEPAKDLNTLADFDKVYDPAKQLVQVAYFNGMGVGGLFKESNFTKNIDNALVYLSTYNREGHIANTGKTVNYSNSVPSSSRLVLYSIDADPVSDIGLHYGEIYKLDVGADAIGNHNGTHSSLIGVALQQILKNGKVGGISQELAAIVNNFKSVSKLAPTDKFIPQYVVQQINSTNSGADVTKYSLASITSNLDADIKSFDKKYSQYGAMIDNLFDHFNMNHETDSFNCIIDKNNGRLNTKNLSLSVEANNMNCQNGKCYSKIPYSMPNTFVMSKGIGRIKEYSLGNAVTDSVLIDYHAANFITLTANIDGGCVKTYNWEYSTDGNNYRPLGTTVNKKIVIPKSQIGASANSSKTVYFRVRLDYGDKFYETKSTINGSVIKYTKSDNYTQFNPTNNEDRTLGNTNSSITSAPVPITFVYDYKAPDCRFEPGSTSIKRGKSANIRFVCNDASAVNFDSGKFKLSFTLLIKGFKYSAKCYNEQKYCDITVTASKNILLTANNQKITYDAKISDAGGNTSLTKATSSVSLKRVK